MLVWASIRNSIAGIGAVKAETIVCVGLAANPFVRATTGRLIAVCITFAKAAITTSWHADTTLVRKAITANIARIVINIIVWAAITTRWIAVNITVAWAKARIITVSLAVDIMPAKRAITNNTVADITHAKAVNITFALLVEIIFVKATTQFVKKIKDLVQTAAILAAKAITTDLAVGITPATAVITTAWIADTLLVKAVNTFNGFAGTLLVTNLP